MIILREKYDIEFSLLANKAFLLIESQHQKNKQIGVLTPFIWLEGYHVRFLLRQNRQGVVCMRVPSVFLVLEQARSVTRVLCSLNEAKD